MNEKKIDDIRQILHDALDWDGAQLDLQEALERIRKIVG